MVTQRSVMFICCILLLSGIALSAAAASLTAQVDRPQLQLTETLRLTLELKDYDGPLNPDLSALETLFDILDTAQSQQVNIINGRMNASRQLVLTLAPKQSGQLTIPAIQIGTLFSQPITIKVSEADTAQNNQAQSALFMEAEVDNHNPYVQQQVIYTLRLYHALNLLEGVLPDPQLSGAEFTRLGEDISYQTTRNGRAYGVIERRYALIPQISGELELPSILFRGQAQEGRRSRIDSMFGSPFVRSQTVQARSPAVTLNIKPRPAQTAGAWLPASRVSLHESWSPDPPVFKVGEPVTRTIRLEADGLSADQLPEMSTPTLPSIKIYPDQPQLETGNNVQGLQATRVEKYAIVPTRPGEYTLPAITLNWWNIKTNRSETATLPATTISVAPAAVANMPAPTPQPGVSTPSAALSLTDADQTVMSPAAATQTDNLWPWYLAVTLLSLAWLMTLYLWWRKSGGNAAKQAPPATGNPNKQLHKLKQACLANDPQQARRALVAWAAGQWPQIDANNLSVIANQIADDALSHELNRLNAALYAPAAEAWNGAALWQAINTGLKAERQAAKQDQQDSALPTLYH